MKWIVIVLLLLPFIFFPKKIFGALGFLVLTGSAIGGFFYYQEWSNKKASEAVSISVDYSASYCDESSPLKVTINNASDKTITMVEWNISAHQTGFSDDLAAPGYQIYSQDKILEPGARWSGCVTLPKLKRDVENVAGLVFSVKDKDVVFK